jgi:hypothetical protein
MEEDDAMEIDETISSAQIIVRESSGIQIIGGPTNVGDAVKMESVEASAQPKKNPDVVVLDDDEDEPIPSKKSKKRLDERVEIIDLVQKSVNSKCINYACMNGQELMVAPNFCLSYFRVKNSGNGKKEVCTECYDMAVREYDMLATELQAGNILCNVKVPIRNDTVEIDDSDEEEQETRVPQMDEDNCKFVEDNFERDPERDHGQVEFRESRGQRGRLPQVDEEHHQGLHRRAAEHDQRDAHLARQHPDQLVQRVQERDRRDQRHLDHRRPLHLGQPHRQDW